jgi:hypothetical protein
MEYSGEMDLTFSLRRVSRCDLWSSDLVEALCTASLTYVRHLTKVRDYRVKRVIKLDEKRQGYLTV